MKHSTAIAAVLASTSTLCAAQVERDLDSHEHGSATLNIALDGTALYLELGTPWDNLVGFEHEPGNDEQKALVDAALTQLKQPEQLFVLDGGDCAVTSVDVDSTMTMSSDNDTTSTSEHDHDEHEKDEHDDEHGHEHEDEHEDEHGHEHEDEHGDEHDDEHAHEDSEESSDSHDHDHEGSGVHATALISYSYSCNAIDTLKTIDVKVFSVWSGFEELDVQMVGPGGQALEKLNNGQSLLDIAQVR